MIEDPVYPVLQNPTVDKCFGIHLNNSKYYGKVFIASGSMTAASDRFYINIKVFNILFLFSMFLN
jgi:metal-dependent amidase/aminoacylase/carboxypeptidase family protein